MEKFKAHKKREETCLKEEERELKRLHSVAKEHNKRGQPFVEVFKKIITLKTEIKNGKSILAVVDTSILKLEGLTKQKTRNELFALINDSMQRINTCDSLVQAKTMAKFTKITDKSDFCKELAHRQIETSNLTAKFKNEYEEYKLNMALNNLPETVIEPVVVATTRYDSGQNIHQVRESENLGDKLKQ